MSKKFTLKFDLNGDEDFEIIINGQKIETIINKEEFLGAWRSLMRWSYLESESLANNNIVIPNFDFSDTDAAPPSDGLSGRS